jgi:hypothetical protein
MTTFELLPLCQLDDGDGGETLLGGQGRTGRRGKPVITSTDLCGGTLFLGLSTGVLEEHALTPGEILTGTPVCFSLCVSLLARYKADAQKDSDCATRESTLADSKETLDGDLGHSH